MVRVLSAYSLDSHCLHECVIIAAMAGIAAESKRRLLELIEI